MSTYRFELQHVGSAFSTTREIPESLWVRASRHTTLTAARKAIEKAYQEMQRICGPSAWNGHYRIIALADTPMKAEAHCDGSWIGGHIQSPQCERHAEIEFIWPAGEPCPESPLPWHDVCPACRKLEAAHIYGNED